MDSLPDPPKITRYPTMQRESVATITDTAHCAIYV
jgi:hypothetical protein